MGSLPAAIPPLRVGAEGLDGEGRHYRLVAPLDRGGMGELHVAETHPAPPSYAVIKRLLPELADQHDYVAMFEAEAGVMRRLDHPHVVRVLGLPMIEGSPCLALEFVDGRSAHDLAARASRLRVQTPPAVAAYVAARIAEALHYVHESTDDHGQPLQLVHRDVSPGNVLIGFDGRVKLTDFGIAKSRMSSVSTTVGIVKGKARYLAPEQILGRPATPQSDVFSLGLVLYEMLTGDPLFERGSIPKTLFAIVHGERRPMSELLPPPAQPLAGVLEHALATDIKVRLGDAAALRRGLEMVVDLLGPPVDAEALGAHLRGVFAGTEGPLTKAGARPLQPPSSVSSLPAPRGGAPLDPAAFEPTPLPTHNPDGHYSAPEPQPPASAPQEVDHALSVLAWLQSRRSEAPSSEAPTALSVAKPRRRRRWRDLSLGAVLGAAVAAPSAWLVARPVPPQQGAGISITWPRGDKVWIDGELVGTSPTPTLPIPAGLHTVEFENERGLRRSFEIRVDAGEILRMGANITRERVEAEP